MNEQNKNNPPPPTPAERFAFDLDIDVDVDLSEDAPAPPRAAPPAPHRASARPRYQAAHLPPPPPRYQRAGTSAAPRIPTPSDLQALSSAASDALPSGDLAHAFASGDPLAYGVELSPDELPPAAASGFDPWADDDWGDDPPASPHRAPSRAPLLAASEGDDSGLADLASLGFESNDHSQEPPSGVTSLDPNNPFADLMDEDGEFIDNDAPPRRRAPSPNSRPTLNFPHLNKPAPAPEPEPDETIRLSPAQAQDLLHHARTPTEELARQLPAPDDGLGNYGQQLLDLGSGFDSFDLSDLAPPDAHHQPPDLDLSIELPWLSHDDAEALQPRAPEPATFDRREHTLPIEAPDLEHVSSGAVEVDLTHSEPEPPLQAPPVSGQLGTESGGFGIVRRHPQGSDPGRAIRTPHPPARTPTGPTTRRASTTTVDPEITRKIDRAQVLRRGGLHEEAQRLLEEVMESDPNNSQARHLFQLNTEAMNQKFLTRLGNLEARPELAVHPRELKGKGLDSRAGYLLTLIDGMSTWQDILELSPMSDEETAELLVYLLREGVIRSR